MAEDKELFERICDDLVELKDTSEMMMDLAYSALLLNSRYLAEEVRLLEERVDRLHTEFELLVLSSRGEDEDRKGIYAQARALFGDLGIGGRCARVYLAYAGGRSNSSCSPCNRNAVHVLPALWRQEKNWTGMVVEWK